ncbi:hypothetical protein Srubr_42010 [Streptomyces rubradiris]|uniref:Uncharacterized protein n=1 Tax=Streptomyces rubradiris TaxID=285531 RepID=A0ABQ3RES4_STRRR|nr:hypothetical protein GCM10018792_10270 [Streptomyces rubradiris]GHI54355.1 hypothetical protein Srubr_42010 [Streptomyces rubradiris]
MTSAWCATSVNDNPRLSLIFLSCAPVDVSEAAEPLAAPSALLLSSMDIPLTARPVAEVVCPSGDRPTQTNPLRGTRLRHARHGRLACPSADNGAKTLAAPSTAW